MPSQRDINADLQEQINALKARARVIPAEVTQVSPLLVDTKEGKGPEPADSTEAEALGACLVVVGGLFPRPRIIH